MTPIAGALLFLSAITHAGWNLISKRDHPTLAFYLVANTIGVLCVLPILFFYWPDIQKVPMSVWHCVNISGLFLAAYMAALAAAYRKGDISTAYPIARSLPVVFVTAATMYLGLGKTVSFGFIIGVSFIVIGCILLQLKHLHEFKARKFGSLSSIFALGAALFITGYTIVDHEALALLRNLERSPFKPLDATLLYMILEAISCSVWKGIFVMTRERERHAVKEVLTCYKVSAAITGIGIYLTYALVLLSMNFVTNVSYVAAFRQLSILLGALFGIVILKESCFIPKIAGLGCIFAGLILVTVA